MSSNKRLIHDILAKKQGMTPETHRPKERIELPPRPTRATFSGADTRPLWKRKRFWTLLVLLPTILFFVVSTTFGSVSVVILPKTVPVQLTALAVTLEKGGEGDGVHFETMVVEESASLPVPATSQEKIERKARGTLVVYNNLNTSSQTLVAGTRFQTSDGRIYKTDAKVTIPGGKMEGGKLVPGSVEAAVTAAEAGEKYNLPLSDFTIPGFSGTPRFAGFYARSKTEMTGGFKGTAMVPKDTDVIDARHRLEEQLREKLLARAVAEIPDGYEFFEGADFYDYTFLPPNSAATSSVSVEAKGTLTALIIERSSLARVLAEKTQKEYADEPVDIRDPDSLNLSFKDKESVDPAKASSIAATFDGKAELVWTFDEIDLKGDLAGKKRSESEAVLEKYYPAIQKAEVVFYPPWLQHFPSKPSEIKVELKGAL